MHSTKKKDALFTGVFTAIVTPFTESRKSGTKIDVERLHEQIGRQIDGGVAGIVPCGTTGESPTLTVKEHIKVIELAKQIADDKLAVLAGTGGNSTEEAIHLTQAAEKAGVNGSLQVAPYYNKPTPEGLFQHFKAVAEVTGLPIILYNIPSRCAVDISVETICRLKEAAPNVVGVKEASGSPDRVTELRRRLGKDFTIFSGDDSLTLSFMAVGADGVISVASNIVPTLVGKMVREATAGHFAEAREIHEKLFPLVKAFFLETNPGPVKFAMSELGWDSGVLRLPLVRVQPETEVIVRRQLVALGALELRG